MGGGLGLNILQFDRSCKSIGCISL